MLLEMSASRIELVLSPALYDLRQLRAHHTVVVVDVLRATTAVCAAFQAGAQEVVPLDSLEPLAHFHDLGYLRAAERGGAKVDGAECGNSPTEYLSMDLRGQRLAYSTTNGTVCMLRAADADRTLVGGFCNISALTRLLVDQPQDLVILCSGWKNDFSIEDTLFAGALCERLVASGVYASCHDAVRMAQTLWGVAKADPMAFAECHASHVQRLRKFGPAAERDIAFAFREDTCPLVPQLTGGRLLV